MKAAVMRGLAVRRLHWLPPVEQWGEQRDSGARTAAQSAASCKARDHLAAVTAGLHCCRPRRAPGSAAAAICALRSGSGASNGV